MTFFLCLEEVEDSEAEEETAWLWEEEEEDLVNGLFREPCDMLAECPSWWEAED